ncbi:hypothetical protein M427DRAFT_134747 [Gonapodya prolifera JEL478]|uniref:ER-bound oxygenase mpaB/mpaB'/Rubber oxygenase catalytic domain-containing protein n=1 Tax=Gonapodya prolifera (strain JEL478) TaxID=1344416 RepID=A0A139AHP5_GONPJ|nr:hypothetical protein M427DRAFT_134747 [Gonapodya prolifera JEL478]|eukprot:KXS15955.1 hypothetical protein M427DRAFT_134747 [Gonapodya prolifera JEL478]
MVATQKPSERSALLPAPTFGSSNCDVLSEIYRSGGINSRFIKYPQIPFEELDRLRFRSDDPADRYLAASKVDVRRDDVVARLKADAEAGDPAAVEMWRLVNDVPDWVDWERIKRGQRVFWYFSGPILMLLLHFSLLFGVAAPKVNKVLMATGYLSKPTKVTFTRLLETTHWIISCMHDDSIRPGAKGWESSIRVRFLHATVRARIRALGKSNAKYYDESFYGVPINIEDMTATLLSFSVGPIDRLLMLGYYVPVQEREDFCHLWRYIGYLSGIPEDMNPLAKGFDFSASFAASVVLHVCDPDETTIELAQGLLRGSSLGLAELALERSSSPGTTISKPKFEQAADKFYLLYAQITRIILGNKYSDFIRVPKSNQIPWAQWLAAHGTMIYFVIATYVIRISRILQYFHISFQKRTLPPLIDRVLGGKPPKFLMRHEPKDENATANNNNGDVKATGTASA